MKIETLPGATLPRDDVMSLLVPELVGTMVSWCLYGILIVQLYLYYLSFSHDSRPIRFTVYGLFLVETLQSLAVSKIAWDLLCNGWGHAEALGRVGWGDALIPLTAGIISGWVQCFYAWRIYVLGKGSKVWKAVAYLIIPLALASSVASIYGGIRVFSFRSVDQVVERRNLFLIWQISTTVCDVAICSSMVYMLQSSRKSVRGSYHGGNMDMTISRLIRITVESNTTTAIAALLALFFYWFIPHSNLFVMMGFIGSKFYSLSFMASLNSRVYGKSYSGTAIASQPWRAHVRNASEAGTRVPVTIFITHDPEDQVSKPDTNEGPFLNDIQLTISDYTFDMCDSRITPTVTVSDVPQPPTPAYFEIV